MFTAENFKTTYHAFCDELSPVSLGFISWAQAFEWSLTIASLKCLYFGLREWTLFLIQKIYNFSDYFNLIMYYILYWNHNIHINTTQHKNLQIFIICYPLSLYICIYIHTHIYYIHTHKHIYIYSVHMWTILKIIHILDTYCTMSKYILCITCNPRKIVLSLTVIHLTMLYPLNSLRLIQIKNCFSQLSSFLSNLNTAWFCKSHASWSTREIMKIY